MNIFIILSVLFGHWIADFVLQKNTKKTLRDKKFISKVKKLSKRIFLHALAYAFIIGVLIFACQFINQVRENIYMDSLIFFFFVFLTHFITDIVVTLVNESYLKKNKRHAFVVSIGFDQFIHYATIFILIVLIY